MLRDIFSGEWVISLFFDVYFLPKSTFSTARFTVNSDAFSAWAAASMSSSCFDLLLLKSILQRGITISGLSLLVLVLELILV